MRNIYIGTEGKVRVDSKEAFARYKGISKQLSKVEVTDFRKYRKLVKAFYSKVGEKMIEAPGGVFLDNFGYFTVIEQPKKQVIRTPYSEDFYNFHTGNKVLSPMFAGIAKNKILLNLWVMDRAFSRRKVKAKLHKAILAGKKFKTYIYTLSSLYTSN